MLDLESLFKLSYGMCIVSSKKADKFNACIVNTVFQVTPEPPIVAVSINRENLTWEYINGSRVFAASILSEETPISFIGTFGFKSGRDIDKFENVNVKSGLTGAPIILDHTVGYIEGQVIESIDVITHTLFIAKIAACRTLQESATPMTYAYYRDVKHGKTPKTATTYQKEEPKQESVKGVGDMKKYRCLMCGYIYDPDKGDLGSGIEPGTVFEDLPDDWVCPQCGVGKEEFEPVAE